MIRIIRRLIKKNDVLLHQIASYIIPKKKKLYAFMPLHDRKAQNRKFSGNIRALMLYIKENHQGINMVLLSNHPEVIKEAHNLGIKTASSYFLTLWYLLRSEYIIVDAATRRYFEKSKMSIIQLWHGTGMKNIALLEDNMKESTKVWLKRVYKKYKLVVATSQSDLERKNASLNTNTSIISGSPRNDIFFDSKINKNKIKIKYNIPLDHRIITYAPTFRDQKTSPPFNQEFWPVLNTVLKKEKKIFIIKKHPSDKNLIIPAGYDHIIDLSKEISDVQELLLLTHVLITDYSGIATDFTLTGNPILIYAYDLNEYLSTCRSFYYDIKNILPKPFIYNQQELLKMINNENWQKSEQYKKEYARFKNTFHQFTDANSSKRVFEEIQKLTQK